MKFNKKSHSEFKVLTYMKSCVCFKLGPGIAHSVDWLGCELDDQGTVVQLLAVERFCSFLMCPDRLWSRPSRLFSGCWGGCSFRGSNAAWT
jgi:hypothetical protein